MFTLTLLSGCLLGLNPKNIPHQELYADDGDVVPFPGAVSFAVVGDTREASPGDRAVARVPVAGAEAAIAADVSRAVGAEGIKFVVLTGNMVSASSTAGWKTFNRDWIDVLSGSELSESGAERVRVIPTAGVSDHASDEWLEGWGAAFPGAGADIGYNRVASWYRFDVQTRGKTWRVLILDSDQAHLGSRWDEQMAWIPTVLSGGGYDSLIVCMNQPLLTLALKQPMNEGGGPKELMAAVEDASPVNALKVVFAGNSGANEAFLPGGKYGELYVNALSGAPAATFARWGHAPDLGYPDLRLESMYDLALLRGFDRWAETKGFSEAVIDRARARGSYQGFVGEYDAHSYPVEGWWNVTLSGDQLSLTFRALNPDNTLSDLHTFHLEGKDGWKIGS